MNGRVYDTRTGRFISADPLVQAPKDTQSYNRYSYVRNNPLKYTDPSGYSWLSKAWKKIKKHWREIAAFGVFFIPGAQLWALALKGFAAGMIASGGDIRAGLIGALTASAFFGVGEAFKNASVRAALGSAARGAKIIAHGLVGGLSTAAQGGQFRHGFLSAGFTQAFAPGIDGIDRANAGFSAARTAVAAIVGGTAAELGGGKFANGAMTGAFSRAFNDEAKHGQQEKSVNDAASSTKELSKTIGEIYEQKKFNSGIIGLVFKVLDFADLAFNSLDITVRWGIKDIQYYRETDGLHVPHTPGSLAHWDQVEWSQYDRGGTPESVMKNFLDENLRRDDQ